MASKHKSPNYAVVITALLAIMLSSCSAKGQDAPPVNASDPSITFHTQAPKSSDLGKGEVVTKSTKTGAPINNHLEIQIPTKKNTSVSPNEIVKYIIPDLAVSTKLNSYIYYNDSGINDSRVPLESKITNNQGIVFAQVTIPAGLKKGKYIVGFEKVISGLNENDSNYKAVLYSSPITVK